MGAADVVAKRRRRWFYRVCVKHKVFVGGKVGRGALLYVGLLCGFCSAFR